MKNLYRYKMIWGFVFALFMSACTDPEIGPEPPPSGNAGSSVSLATVWDFHFDEADGTQTFESNTNSPLDIMQDYSDVVRLAGIDGNAIRFDGITTEVMGNVTIGDLSSEQMSISLFVALEAYPNRNAGFISTINQFNQNGFMVGINPYGQIIIQIYINNELKEYRGDYELPVGRWVNLMVTINTLNSTITLYENGNEVYSESMEQGAISLPATNAEVYIGRSSLTEDVGLFPGNFIKGTIDEIKVLNGIPTGAERQSILASYGDVPGINLYTTPAYLAGDPNRPFYHPIPPSGWANEAHGMIYASGKYHLFYQKSPGVLGIDKQKWGYMTSDDAVDWEEMAPALSPGAPPAFDSEGCWAGCSIINPATNRPILYYTGVDGVKAAIGAAEPNATYTNFIKSSNNPLIAGRPVENSLDFRDPYVWEAGGKYFMAVGAGKANNAGGILWMYESTDLYNWTFMDKTLMDDSAVNRPGVFWEVPIVQELDNGKYMVIVQNTPPNAQTQYWIGDFDAGTGTFTPDNPNPTTLEVINGFLSPTITRDPSNRLVGIGIIPDEPTDAAWWYDQGWANLFSIPQIWEVENNRVKRQPHPDLVNYREPGSTIFNNLAVSPSGSNYISSVQGRHLEMKLNVSQNTATSFGIVVGRSPSSGKETTISYNFNSGVWEIDASNSIDDMRARTDSRTGIYQAGSTIDLHVFIDGSVIEVFINNEEAFTGRFFTNLDDATEIDLFATGGEAMVNNMEIWQMQNIND